ncbi:MAG TPA: transketolase family protein, partial [Armatimonadota bacterium]|nr:transketolase family protein [Armatimonadota bacterium]
AGGLGNIVAGVVSRHPASAGALIDQIGVCGFGESGDPWVLMKAFGLCAEFIAQRGLKVLKEKG